MIRGAQMRKFKLTLRNIPKYILFFSELHRYEQMPGAERIARRDLSGLEMIPVIRAVWSALPVIVIADED